MLLDPLTQKLIGSGSPFELIGAASAQGEIKIYRHAPATLPQLYQHALKKGERELIVFGDVRLTFKQSQAAAGRTAALLQTKYAIGPGSRVAVLIDGTPEWLIVFLALTSLGAVPVLIGRRDASQIEHCIDVSRCALVIADENGVAWARDGQPLWSDARDLLAEADQRQLQLPGLRAPLAAEEAVVLFTSGSTGNPKAVSLSHRNVISGLMNMMLGSALAAAEDRDRASSPARLPPCALIHTPLCYIGGVSAVLMAIMNGTRLVITSGWSIDAVRALVEAEQVTALPHIGRAQLEELLAQESVVQRLSSIGLHGASVPRRLIELTAASVPALKIVSGYGLTETSGSIAVISGSTLRSRPGSSGRIVPAVQASLGPAPLDGSGELLVAGACVMSGYLHEGNVSEVTWFNTGDIAHIAEDGHIYVDHRNSESSIIGGMRFNPAAVERDLEDLDGVAEVCVMTSAQRTCVDIVVAMMPGRTMEHSLIERAAVAAIGASGPVRIHTFDSLPRTPSGKVNRAALRASLAVSHG